MGNESTSASVKHIVEAQFRELWKCIDAEFVRALEKWPFRSGEIESFRQCVREINDHLRRIHLTRSIDPNGDDFVRVVAACGLNVLCSGLVNHLEWLGSEQHRALWELFDDDDYGLPEIQFGPPARRPTWILHLVDVGWWHYEVVTNFEQQVTPEQIDEINRRFNEWPEFEYCNDATIDQPAGWFGPLRLQHERTLNRWLALCRDIWPDVDSAALEYLTTGDRRIVELIRERLVAQEITPPTTLAHWFALHHQLLGTPPEQLPSESIDQRLIPAANVELRRRVRSKTDADMSRQVHSDEEPSARLPSQRFWDEASRCQKAIMRHLLKASGYRIKANSIVNDPECFLVTPASIGSIRKAVERLVKTLAKTAHGWHADRSPMLDCPDAEIWLIHRESDDGQR